MSAPTLTPEISTEFVEQPRSTTLRWAELGLVCFVAFWQPIYISIVVLLSGESRSGSASQSYTGLILLEVGALALLAYVLHISKRKPADLGIKVSAENAVIGFLLFLSMSVAYYFAAYSLQASYRYWNGALPEIRKVSSHLLPSNIAVAVVVCLINPIYEELIVRGYLMSELSSLTKSSVLAIVVSVLLQTSYHLYQGWFLALSLLPGFLILAIVYSKTRNLFAVVAAHAFADAYAFYAMFASKPH